MDSRQEGCPVPSSSIELTSAVAVLVAAKLLLSNVIISSQGASFLLSQWQFYILFLLTIKQNILKLYSKEGLNPIVSPELEFYLVKPNPDSDYPLEVPVGQSGRQETGKQALGIDAVNEFDNLFEEVYSHCEAQNIEIDTINHESGSAQMEINFQHGDPLDLADQVFIFKRTLRQTALKHKLYATFMAKPMENQPGSSMHLHQSLYDEKNKYPIYMINDEMFTPEEFKKNTLYKNVNFLCTVLI